MKLLVATPRFTRDWNKLTADAQKQISTVFDTLQRDPRSLDTKRLRGEQSPVLRIRIGDYRVLYSEKRDTIYLLRIGHRKDVYR